MSTVWIAGRTYDYYGSALLCVRRWFDGPLEMVDLSLPGDAPEIFTRTARALRWCVIPRVTATLGGVTHPHYCDHRCYPRTVADGGPHAGALCCTACGTPAGEERQTP